MAEMMMKSKFVGVEFPLDEVTHYEITHAPIKEEFFMAAGARGCPPIGFSSAMEMRSKGEVWEAYVDGFIYIGTGRDKEHKVAFVGTVAERYDPNAKKFLCLGEKKFFPCFGEIDFTNHTGEIVVHNRVPVKN